MLASAKSFMLLICPVSFELTKLNAHSSPCQKPLLAILPCTRPDKRLSILGKVKPEVSRLISQDNLSPNCNSPAKFSSLSALKSLR